MVQSLYNGLVQYTPPPATAVSGAATAGGIGSIGATAPATTAPTTMPVASSTQAANDSDIAARIAQITSRDSPLMRQAATSGLKLANRRGLANSSMGIGSAYNATISAAGAIASQESQERNARDQNVAQIASREREAQLQAFTMLDGNYQQSLASINSIKGIKAKDRAAQQAALRDRLSYSTSWMQQLYGVGPAPRPAGT